MPPGSRLLLCSVFATLGCTGHVGLTVKGDRGDTRHRQLVACSGSERVHLDGMTRCFCSRRGDQTLVLCLPKEWSGQGSSPAALAVQTGTPSYDSSCYYEGIAKIVGSGVDHGSEAQLVTLDVPDLQQQSRCSGSMTACTGFRTACQVHGTIELPVE